MKSKLKLFVLATKMRLQHFFLGGEERVFESCLSAEEIKHSISDSTHGFLDYSEGAKGYVMGNNIHVGWSYGWMWSRSGSGPVFHGVIEPSQNGSRVRGRMSAGFFARAFMAVFIGFVMLLSLVFVWTLLIPAAGMLLIWIASHMISDPEADTKIIDYLSHVCGSVGQDAASQPTCSTNSPR